MRNFLNRSYGFSERFTRLNDRENPSMEKISAVCYGHVGYVLFVPVSASSRRFIAMKPNFSRSTTKGTVPPPPFFFSEGHLHLIYWL